MADLAVQALTAKAFSPFGDVIEARANKSYLINSGTTRRFHDLARVEASGPKGAVLINIFRGEPFALPIEISMMERHPLASQAFMPLQPVGYLVVVAKDARSNPGKPDKPVAFLAAPGQGVNYHRNVWHHPLLVLQHCSDFLVVDRAGGGENLQEARYRQPYVIRRVA